MNEVVAATRSGSGWRHVGRVVFAISLVGALLGTIVPATVIGWLRAWSPQFAHAWDGLDASLPGFNPLHAIAYAWVAMLWRLLAPRAPRWRMPLILLGLGILGELAQNFVPGRDPRVSDVLSDVVGIFAGWALGAILARLSRRR